VLRSREVKELRGLRQRRYREETGRFLAEGLRVVEDLLASGLRLRWIVTASSIEDTERGRDIVARIDREGIVRRTVPDRDFAQFSATEAPQGVLAVADIPAAQIDELSFVRDLSVVLILDAVQDPGNLGTLIRSAEAFAASAVVVMPGSVDPWNPKVVRASAGSSFRVPIVRTSWGEARAALHLSGFEIMGAAPRGSAIGAHRPARAALVVGNEGAGLSAEVLADVDRLIGIPTPGRAESLNVTAAAAILLYELTR
jgi:RNA methyltransferase, TrmH family